MERKKVEERAERIRKSKELAIREGKVKPGRGKNIVLFLFIINLQ